VSGESGEVCLLVNCRVKQEAQRGRRGKHPLADRSGRQYLVHQQGGAFHHAPGATTAGRSLFACRRKPPASRGNRVAGIHNIELQFMSDPEFRALWSKLSTPELSKMYLEIAEELGISKDETMKVVSYGSNWLWLHWGQFRSIKSPEDGAELKNIISAWYSDGPMRTLIDHQSFRLYFDQEFIKFIDNNIGKKI
jgi:hypothetical protein